LIAVAVRPAPGAVMHPNGKAYFFRGDEYQRYDFQSDHVDKQAVIGVDGYPVIDAWTDDTRRRRRWRRALFRTGLVRGVGGSRARPGPSANGACMRITFTRGGGAIGFVNDFAGTYRVHGLRSPGP